MSLDERDTMGAPRGRLSSGGAAAGLIFCVCTIGFLAWRFTPTATREEDKRPPQAARVLAGASNMEIDDKPVQTAAFHQPAVTPPPAPRPLPQTPQIAAPTMAQTPRLPHMMTYAVRNRPPEAPAANGSTAAAAGAEAQQPRQTGVAFAAQRFPGLKAGPAIDQTYVLMPGVYRCTLDTAVNSERAGPFFCHNDQGWKSPLGVTLVDPLSVIQGSYQSDVRQGQSRISTVAAMGFTPRGVPFPIGAPVGDAIGRNGMDGTVNRHTWERLEGAAYLLLGQGAIQAAQTALQASLQHGSGNSYVNLNTGSVQSVVAELLRGSFNIPNTVEKNQGEEIGILITQPIDFSDAYRLRRP